MDTEKDTKITVEDAAAEDTAVLNKVGENEIKNATEILERYKQGKAVRDAQIVQNQEWWKKRWCSSLDTGSGDRSRIKPRSSWLHSCIDNKAADYMDHYPEPNILPKEPDDEETAKILTSIVPVILEQNGFKNTYRKVTHYKVENGTGVYGVFWNQKLLNGLGDVEVRKQDVLNLFWEPGIDNIQKSPHFFSVELVDNKQLQLEYPELKDKLGRTSFSKAEYINEESISTDDKSYVIDWYYKANVNGKDVVHYAKFVDGFLLYSTENDPELTDIGLYDDGQYPFVFDVLFPVANSCTGYGYFDLNQDAQMYIDKMEQAFVENAICQATPRFMVSDAADINEADFADFSKHIIKAGGSVGSDAINPIMVNPISSSAYSMYMQKIDEMKETSGNKDVTTGGTASGVTAASAITAMQEAGSKTSRWQIDGSYDAFKNVVLMVIERIRQFYDLPRTFRIIGENAAYEFVEFSNELMQKQALGLDIADDEEYTRLPLYDVEVTASKASPYSKLAENELQVQLYQLGVYQPNNADQALALLDGMDFNHKQDVIDRVEQNGTMFEYIQQMTQALMAANQIITQLTGQDLMTGMPDPMAMQGAVDAPQGNVMDPSMSNNLGDINTYKGNSTTAKARKRVAESTSPV